MHVLVIPSFFPSARNPVYGTFFREQAEAIAAAGCRVGVLALETVTKRSGRGQANAVGYEDPPDLTIMRRTVRPLMPRFPQRQALLWLRHGRRLYRDYVRQHGRPDLIHAHNLRYAGLLAASIRRTDDVPFVLTEHSTVSLRGKVRWWERLLYRRVIAAAAGRIAVSRTLRDALVRCYGGNAEPCEIIPNCVDPIFTRPIPASPARRDGRGDSPFRFVSIGRLAVGKGFDDLIEAFAAAFGASRIARVTIIGAGAERRRFESAAERHGIQDLVAFAGARDRTGIRDALLEADAFVLASHYETFGVVFIEALACGRPVIATRSGPPEEFIEPGDGFLVPTRDPAALAAAMIAMIDRRASFDGAGIRRRALARFAPATVASSILRVYNAALAIPELGNRPDEARTPYRHGRDQRPHEDHP